jgi:hypothetical protein
MPAGGWGSGIEPRLRRVKKPFIIPLARHSIMLILVSAPNADPLPTRGGGISFYRAANGSDLFPEVSPVFHPAQQTTHTQHTSIRQVV